MCILFSTKATKIHSAKNTYTSQFLYNFNDLDFYITTKTASVKYPFLQTFPEFSNFRPVFIENYLCKKVVFGVNCWKYFLIVLISFRSSSDKFVSGHFALYKLIAETLTFRASNLFLENPYFHDCSWIELINTFNHLAIFDHSIACLPG